MDRLFNLIVITGLCGTVVAFTLFVEWYLDDDKLSKEQHDDDSDMHIYVPHRSGNRRGNNGQNKQHEGREQ